MSELQNFLCWEAETAAATINTEAVNPSPAVFLATHAPLRIRQARIQGRGLVRQDIEVGEQDVLDDFLKRKSDTGTLLMPIVGDSGSGKSHLVRWVRERIRGRDEYQVIYLEKSRTSLKAVVEELLTGVQDPSLDKLRADIDSFSTGLDEEALARRLVNALNETFAALSPRDLQGSARMLAGSKGLAAILQDPYIQNYILAEGQFIPTLASQLLNNRAAGTPDRPPGFAPSDLPLSVDDINSAARVSAMLLNKMMSSPELQSAAADLINQYLEAAVRSVSNLGSGRLFEAMLQVREAYARQGKEIILLVEDFALVQGVQRELLEALTEAATREGRRRYAPMRTLMAITTGYFQELPETVMTRVSAATSGYVYDLDRTFSQDDDGATQITSFVGRYLNAARVGHQELEKSGLESVPNKCTSCEFQKSCHEAFGSTEEGYGLYPFNSSALKRMVHSVAPSDRPWAFIPRTVLGSVVRPVLIEHAPEISTGSFPSKRLKERFRTAAIDTALSASVEGAVEQVDKISPERRKVLLEFWGDAPRSINAIDPTILKAFSLRQISGEAPGPSKDENKGKEERPKDSGTTGELSRSQQQKIRAIEDWSQRQAVLPQSIANDLRSIVAEAVFRRYNWSSPLMRELPRAELTNAWPNSSTVVSIEGSSERLAGSDRAPIKFTRNAMNSQFFQSLYVAKEGTGKAQGEHLRRLAKLADLYRPKVSEAIARSLEISDEELIIGMRASLIGAALGGRAWPSMDEADLLSAVMDDGASWSRNGSPLRIDSWQRFLAGHLENRFVLVGRLRAALGVAQGSGSVRMIDAARALPLLRSAKETWHWETPEGLPSWVKPAVKGFDRWNTLVLEQFDMLEQLLKEVRQLFVRGENGKETAKAVRSAWGEAEKVGLAPDFSQRERLNNLLKTVEAADWSVVTDLEKDITKAAAAEVPRSLEAVLPAAAPDRGTALVAIRDFLRQSDLWLASALNQAASRSDNVGDATASVVQNLLDEWATLIETEENDD